MVQQGHSQDSTIRDEGMQQSDLTIPSAKRASEARKAGTGDSSKETGLRACASSCFADGTSWHRSQSCRKEAYSQWE
jgi:hypothetical protein